MAVTITQLHKYKQMDDDGVTPLYWVVDVEARDNGNAYAFTVAGIPISANIQNVLNNRKDDIFAAAQALGQPVDVLKIATPREQQVAVVESLVIELNVIRAALVPPLPAITGAQFRLRIKDRLIAHLDD
jgi:hypothetical protein